MGQFTKKLILVRIEEITLTIGVGLVLLQRERCQQKLFFQNYCGQFLDKISPMPTYLSYVTFQGNSEIWSHMAGGH